MKKFKNVGGMDGIDDIILITYSSILASFITITLFNLTD